MDAIIAGLTVLVLILLFLGSGVWVFIGLLLVSTSGLFLVLDFPAHRIGAILGKILFRSASSWELAAIPLFIWMGEMILRTDISAKLFRGSSTLGAPYSRRLDPYKCCWVDFVCRCLWIVRRNHGNRGQDHIRRIETPRL